MKDDRLRALEDERTDVQRRIEAQRREFTERYVLLKSDHEMLLKAVRHWASF